MALVRMIVGSVVVGTVLVIVPGTSMLVGMLVLVAVGMAVPVGVLVAVAQRPVPMLGAVGVLVLVLMMVLMLVVVLVVAHDAFLLSYSPHAAGVHSSRPRGAHP